MNRLLVCFSIVSASLLAACGSKSEPEAAVAAAPKPVDAPAAGDPVHKMARAVGNGKPGAAVVIRYEFAAKPSVGAPTEVEVAFIPNVGVDSLDATITGMDGVTIAGPATASFTKVESGKPYTHTVSVLPDRNGVFYLSVVVNTQIGGSTLARTFSIPFVVGNVSVQQKAAPARDASGEPIESMKAQESG